MPVSARFSGNWEYGNVMQASWNWVAFAVGDSSARNDPVSKDATPVAVVCSNIVRRVHVVDDCVFIVSLSTSGGSWMLLRPMRAAAPRLYDNPFFVPKVNY